MMSRNQYILFTALVILLIVLGEQIGGAPSMNIYEFWQSIRP
jgi:hypothetical protein